MSKQPTEKLAAALRANLKRRKQPPPASSNASGDKDPEKSKEKSPTKPVGLSRGT